MTQKWQAEVKRQQQVSVLKQALQSCIFPVAGGSNQLNIEKC